MREIKKSQPPSEAEGPAVRLHPSPIQMKPDPLYLRALYQGMALAMPK
jgi:hypothetical protein